MSLLSINSWIILSSIGCFLSGVFTILLFIVGIRQIKRHIGLGELDLYYRLKQDFSTPESIKLFRCIVGNMINVNEVNDCPVLTQKGGNPITDDLLNNIEDMCIFYDRKLIGKDTIIEGYGTIIQITFESLEIKDYITRKRIFYNSNSLHTGLEKLYGIINE